jgi:hypothetical protein
VYELGVRTDNLEARKKIDALRLSEDEWHCVGIFCALLSVRMFLLLFNRCSLETQHADKAQQAFSSEQTPTLFNAVPALETLHAAWTSRAKKFKYQAFMDALNAAAAKLNKYYKKTAESDAHILAMCTYHRFLTWRRQLFAYNSQCYTLNERCHILRRTGTKRSKRKS